MDKGNSALGPGDQPDADLEASSKRLSLVLHACLESLPLVFSGSLCDFSSC